MLCYWVIDIFGDKYSKRKDESYKVSLGYWGEKILYEEDGGRNDRVRLEDGQRR